MSENNQEILQNHITERKPVKSFARSGLKRKLNKTRRELLIAEEERDTDTLTGLLNRRVFLRMVREEAERIKRYGGESTVVILDADKLKAKNDLEGHSAGDKYLISIADALKKGTRRGSDTAFRIGGDEFALILLNTNIEGTEKMWIESLNPEFLKDGIAVSAGAALLNHTNVQATIDRADSAMYGAKKEPRNNENLLISFIGIPIELKNG